MVASVVSITDTVRKLKQSWTVAPAKARSKCSGSAAWVQTCKQCLMMFGEGNIQKRLGTFDYIIAKILKPPIFYLGTKKYKSQ